MTQDIQALAKELPEVQPDAAKRAALRASLLEAAASARPAARGRGRQRAALAVAALAAAAAAVVLGWPRDEEPRRVAAIQSSSGADFEQRVDARGVDVVRLRAGKVAVAEDVVVETGDAAVEVEGARADVVRVVVEGDRLAEVSVASGKAVIRFHDQRTIVLGAGDRWVAESVTVKEVAVLEPAAPAPAAPEPEESRQDAENARTTSKRAPGDPGALTAPPRAPTEAPAIETTPPELAVKKAPTATEGAFARGFAAMRRGDHGEAAAQMEIAIASGPDEPLAADARYWRGVALARAGRAVMARDAMIEFLDRHAGSPRAGQASVMLGWILLEAGDRTAAYRRFRAAERDHDPAVRDSAAKGLAALRDDPR